MYKKNEMKSLEEILFGCAVCINDPIVSKSLREPFAIKINSKTENKIFGPLPPVFAKTLKTEVELKVRYILDDSSLTLDIMSSNP